MVPTPLLAYSYMTTTQSEIVYNTHEMSPCFNKAVIKVYLNDMTKLNIMLPVTVHLHKKYSAVVME